MLAVVQQQQRPPVPERPSQGGDLIAGGQAGHAGGVGDRQRNPFGIRDRGQIRPPDPVREPLGSGRLVAEPGGELDGQTRFPRAAQSNQYGQPLLRSRPHLGQHAPAKVRQICGTTHEPGEIGRQSRRPEVLLGRHSAHNRRLEKVGRPTVVGSSSAWTGDSRCAARSAPPALCCGQRRPLECRVLCQRPCGRCWRLVDGVEHDVAPVGRLDHAVDEPIDHVDHAA